MERKYEFTGEEKQFCGKILKRIRRISDGLVGGWIEKEYNLSQDGTCFVFDNACVYDNARLSGNACIYDRVRIYGKARIFGKARVLGGAVVFGDACVSGNACVFDEAIVYGKARVSGKARVFDNARVSGDACVFDEAIVYGKARVSGDACVFDEAIVYGKARVLGGAVVFGEARVFGDMLCTQDVMYARLYRYIITCSDSHVSVGCQVHVFDVWKERGLEIAKEDGRSDEEIELYKGIILSMIVYREATNQERVKI